jgi:putative phosphoesterase
MLQSSLPAEVVLGLIADTHCHAGGITLPDAALAALRGCGLILHLGDMGDSAVLDQLAAVAPVLATRGGDDPPQDPRIADGGRLLAGPELALAAAFELGQLVPGAKSEGHVLPPVGVAERLAEGAGRAVQVVAFAATHSPAIFACDGVLFVNPGSATLPAVRGPSGLGTVARLTLRGRATHAEIVPLG